MKGLLVKSFDPKKWQRGMPSDEAPGWLVEIWGTQHCTGTVNKGGITEKVSYTQPIRQAFYYRREGTKDHPFHGDLPPVSNGPQARAALCEDTCTRYPGTVIYKQRARPVTQHTLDLAYRLVIRGSMIMTRKETERA